LHAIDVQSAMEMIDFVLQDSGIPSGRFNRARFSSFV